MNTKSCGQAGRTAEQERIARLLLSGGRFVKVKGILASVAPNLASVGLVVGLSMSLPALAADVVVVEPASNAPVVVTSPGVDNVTITSTGLITNGADTAHAPVNIVTDANSKTITVDVHDVTTTAGANGGIFITTAGTGDVNVRSSGDVTGNARGINITHTGAGNVSVESTGTITGSTGGVRVVGRSQPGFDVKVHVNQVTTATNVGAALDVSNTSDGGATILTADGTLTNTAGHVIRINAVDGIVNGAVGGPLTINVKDIVSGTRGNPAQLFTSGGGDGIQLVGAVGAAGAPQPTRITTGDIDATGTGVNLGYNINRVDGPTTVTTGNIVAGGAGVVIDSGDDSNNYAIDVKTGNVTTGSTGITVNQSGTGSISVETGDINAGTANSGVNGFQNGGGYGVRLDSDAHGATTAGPGGSDWNLVTGNITVTDRGTGNFAGTGIGLGTIQNGGNGNTTVTAGDIQAGTGVVYNRNGTGAVSLTTGDITATAGNGIQFGTNLVRNDLAIKTGDIDAAGYGIFGDTGTGAGATHIETGNITSANAGINVVHSGTGAATIIAGDITSSAGRGVVLVDDAGGANPGATTGGVAVTVNNVSSRGNAIEVSAHGNQASTVITANGAITASNGQGIVLVHQSSGAGAGDATVIANGAVTASATAISVTASGPGDANVQADGDVTGTGGYGVIVSKSGDGNASIITGGTVKGRTGISLATNGVSDATIHAQGLVEATAGTAIQVTGFGNGNLDVVADQGVTATGNGIDLGGSVNSAGNVGSISITAGGMVSAGGIGINGDTGGNTKATTIKVADLTAGSTGINWINSGTQPLQITSTGTITSGGVGINVTTDAGAFNSSPDSQTVITVNNIDSANNTAIAVNSNAAKGTLITTNGAINTPAAGVISGDGMRVTESRGPLVVNIAASSSITSYNNTMELTNSGTAGTTVNVDGVLRSTALTGGSEGVIWAWGTPGLTTVNLNDGASVQAVDRTGYAMTDNGGDSVVNVGNATVRGGFRLGAGDDVLTFNGTDMTDVGTLDGGAGSSGGDVLNLNAIHGFTRRLQTSSQEIRNWDAVNLNGGSADLVGTLASGSFTLGTDAGGAPAVLSIGAGNVGDTLTVTGNYIGAGGGLTLDTDASTHTSDRLVVGGNVSGVTGLSLNDMTPGAALSDLQDIEVVDVAGASPGGAFVLAAGPAVLGGRAYVLQQGDSAGANLRNWFLALQPCPAGGLDETNGATLGCKTDDTLVLDGTSVIAGNLEGGGGRDKLTVAGGASVGGIVAGGYAGADASAALDDADLIIINTSGSVGGVKGNLGDDLIYVVGSSTVKGNVEGNEGNNQIRIGGLAALPDASVPTTDAVTVTGDVRGGDGQATDGNNQIWVLGGAHVAGNVIGGNGNDILVLNGTTAVIDGATDGGAGNDIIALMKGSVGSVSGGDGDDRISLDGATVAGMIDGGEGNNTIMLNAGSAAGVSTGAGADSITLAGAFIGGDISSGAGDDVINLVSGTLTGSVQAGAGADTLNVAGATFTLGSTRLDGGAEGEGNTLNLSSVNQTLVAPQSNLVNWDTINADASTLTVGGSDSLKAAQVNLLKSSIVARDGFTINGNLGLNLSTLDLQDSAVGDVFKVNGNYAAVGTGSGLKIDADFASDTADQLHVSGSITGVTALNVKDVTPASAQATGQDVLVAKAGGSVDASSFSLVGGPVVNGIWEYNLANGTEARTVVLRGGLNALAALYSGAAGALADAFGELPTLEERVGQRQWLAGDNDGAFQGLWIRLSGDRATRTPHSGTVDSSTQSRTWGMQVGADFALFENEGGLLTAGITGQYKGMDAKISKAGQADRGKLSADGGGGGLNLTWNGTGGTYLDLQGQYNKASADLGTTQYGDTKRGLDVDSTSASLEVGKRVALNTDRRRVLVPQAQLSWNQLRSDSFTDAKGVKVDLGDYESSTARLGLAYEYHPGGMSLAGPGKDAGMFYGIVNVLRNLSPSHTAIAQGKRLVTRDERTWGELGVGGSYAFGRNALIYGQATYSRAFGNAGGNHGVSGTVGVRWDF